ncbi:unnamed protein product [Discosporangium mesarthrocarpum]
MQVIRDENGHQAKGDGAPKHGEPDGWSGGERRKFKDPSPEEVDMGVARRMEEAESTGSKAQAMEALMKRYNSRMKTAVDEWLKEKTDKSDEGYSKCSVDSCGKARGGLPALWDLFKADEFVHKHLINKHPQQYKAVVDETAEPFVRELFLADDARPLPNIWADSSNQPVGMPPGGVMGGPPAGPMGGGFPMIGGMPMGPMGPGPGPMGPVGPSPMGLMGGPMPGPPGPPPDGMGWGGPGGRGFRGHGGPGFRGRGGRGMLGRGGGTMGRGGQAGLGKPMPPAEPMGPEDPRPIISYLDVDAPKEETPALDYGNAFPSFSKKKKARKSL